MNYVQLPNRKIVENRFIVKEEERGSASDLMPNNTTFLTDAAREKIQKLSVLEVIT